MPEQHTFTDPDFMKAVDEWRGQEAECVYGCQLEEGQGAFYWITTAVISGVAFMVGVVVGLLCN